MVNIDKFVEQIYNSIEKIDDSSKESDLIKIKEIVEPTLKLMEQAKKDKQYIHVKCSSLWFSPNKLEEEMYNGNYVYHVDSLEMRDPTDRLRELEDELEKKKEKIKNFRLEIIRYDYGDRLNKTLEKLLENMKE